MQIMVHLLRGDFNCYTQVIYMLHLLPISTTAPTHDHVDGMLTFFGQYISFRPCLVPKKFCKIFQVLCHIKSLDVCMEY